MQIRIRRYDPQKEEKSVLPSSGNFRKQDLFFLRFIIIILIIALLYCVPYRLIIINDPHEKHGILQNVNEVKTNPRHGPHEIVGLNLQIDGEVYYLSGKYIDWDEYYLSGKQIEGKSTDEEWKVKHLAHKLKKSIDQPITIQYLKYNEYVDGDHQKIIEAASADTQWIDKDYALFIHKTQIYRNAVLILLSILASCILYCFRRNFVLDIKRSA